MTRRLGTVVAALLVPVVLSFTAGCQSGNDDEMVPPSRTVTVTPSAAPRPVPASVPVGRGVVPPGDVVWAHGDRLHVGERSVDLAPVGIDAFVSVPGGVYVLSHGGLWFTDLSRLKDTGITDVTGLALSADARRILVEVASTGKSTYAFDASTGHTVSSRGVEPVTAEERLRGPERRGVPVPPGFELAGWVGPRTFYGVATPPGRPATVVSCGVGTRVCTRLGTVEASQPVLFGTGR